MKLLDIVKANMGLKIILPDQRWGGKYESGKNKFNLRSQKMVAHKHNSMPTIKEPDTVSNYQDSRK